MIKRIVILQDEQLVVREIQRNMQRAAATAQRRRSAARRRSPRFPPERESDRCRGAFRPRRSRTRGSASATRTRRGEEGESLAAVAKAASMKAERVAIEETLHQVHWNRRKAAEHLGVSYKTLLNKIKECGISRA